MVQGCKMHHGAGLGFGDDRGKGGRIADIQPMATQAGLFFRQRQADRAIIHHDHWPAGVAHCINQSPSNKACTARN